MEEQLNVFVKLDGFICPPAFWPALGYTGPAHYVAIYWEQCGDEAAWADGRLAVVGAYWPAYQALIHHNFSPNHPLLWLLGASDAEAMFWLVVERATGRAWLVPPLEASRILNDQWPAADMVDYTEVSPMEYQSVIEMSAFAINEALEQAIESYEELVRALAERPAAWRKEKQP